MRKQVLNLILLMVAAAPAVFAQTTVKFNGLGRAAVQNDAISDTTSLNEGRRTGGHTLLDLGVTVTRDEILRVNTILRVRNEFGGFFGEGTSFEFRQMRIEGLIGNALKYEIGDLDVGLTPYTIFNEDEIWHDYESELFGIKRDVVNYENFYTDDNTWRMQGVNLYTTLKFDQVVDKLKLRAFGNRIRSTDFISVPSRFVYGANAIATNNEFGSLGVNYVTTADIAGTVLDSEVDYNNTVMTVNYDFNYDINSDITIGAKGEIGSSKLDMYRASDDSTVTADGSFFDVGASVTYKPLNLTVGGSYHAVDKNFSSPTAQTLRLGNFAGIAPQVFGSYNNGDPRELMLFDRYSQDVGVYNQSIATTLMQYNPVYGNVTPYGAATPNRQGISLYAEIDSSKFYEARVGIDLLSEVSAENDTTGEFKRSFTAIKAGGKLYINKLLALDKEISVSGGARLETTTRDGIQTEFKSTLLDVGVDVEALSNLHVLAGYKSVSAEGNEFILARNEFNQIDPAAQPNSIRFDRQEGIMALGLKYNFSEYAFFSVQGQFVTFTNGEETTTNPNHEYDLNQVYFNYTVKF